MRRRLLVLWLAAGMVAPVVAAERYALLVGVSELPAMPRSAWLKGPRYDVPAMRSALLAQGFSAPHIVSLADGVEGAAAPTRNAILSQLTQFGKTLRADDVLVIYWSGHGLLMPGQPGVWQTPSGQQVHLLTRDAAIDARSKQLAGSISSTDIGRAIDGLAARRVQVVALFDSCYAAGSTRGDAGLIWRGLSGAALGWSPRPPSLGGRRVTSDSVTPEQMAAAPRERPLFIGFFAAEPQQRSAESLSGDAGQARGIFTRALIAGLGDSPSSYLAWAGATNQHYREELDARQLPATARPSPVYAGTLEQTLWTATFAPVLWPVRQDGRGWYVPYGRLDGLQTGDLLQRGAGSWRVSEVSWGEARLTAPDNATAATAGWASRMPASMTATGTVTGTVAGTTVSAIAGTSAVAILGRQGSAGNANVNVSVTLPGRSAVRLRVAQRELPALRARAASIAALLALPSTAAAAPLLQARIEVQAPGQPASSLPFTDRELGALAPGTRLRVVVENGGEDSVDLGIVHLPLTGPATRVFPPYESDSNRLPPGTPVRMSYFEREFEVTAQGAAGAPEWLALVAAPAANGAMPRRFALLDALRPGVGVGPDASAERGVALAAGHNPDQAQVARISWRVATGDGR